MNPAALSITAVVLFWLSALGVLTLIPKQLAFTYDNNACIAQWTLFPGAMTQTKPSGYEVVFKDTVRLGEWPAFSTKTCLQPTSPPKIGQSNVSFGLFGWAYPARQIAVTVPEAPVANVQPLIGSTISTVRPLTISLDRPDYVYQYQVKLNDKVLPCQPQEADLRCDIAQGKLLQGSEYQLTVERTFAGQGATQLASGMVTTLQPLTVTERSLTADQVVYDKPTQATFQFDQPIVAMRAKLEQKDGASLKPISTTIATTESSGAITFSQPLARQASFILTIDQAEARDGRSLAAPVVIPFTTSGGPKVASVSVGNSNVGQNAGIVFTFDQPIAKDVDMTQFAKLSGVPGVLRKLSDTQFSVTLQSAPLCAPFSVSLAKGVKSGSNDEVSAEPWKFDSRTICGTSAVLGYSVRGRAIMAYYFGSGTNTILFTGGIHGNERSSQQTMQAWVDYLYANAYRLPANTRVVVVPNMNPDGIATGARNNANNVNIGRNFPTANWSASIQTASGTLPTGGGTSPLSEPESRAVATITRQLRPRLEVSFHSQGRLVGANKVADSVAIGNNYANTVGYGTMYYNAEEVMGYTISGEYEDWMGESMGLPAILIELPSHGGNYLSSQLNALWKMVNM